ncbi:MAG: phage scaffolding protein [Clostridia bacterium]|nr:phage scaffolding protein [Clostridia bacterium]
MQRKFLEELGLEKDAIDKIMAEYGKDIEKHKSDVSVKNTELDAIKAQLDEANRQIQAFREMDIDGIKRAAEEYRTKLEKAQTDSQKQIEDLKFGYALDAALTNAKAKNAKAVKALLDMDGLKLNGDEIVGLSQQLEKIKAENDYLFESSDIQPQIVKAASNTDVSDSFFASVRSAAGLKN